MNPELVDLKISDRELERLIGCKSGSIFVGDMLSGACRPSVFQHPQRLWLFGLAEVMVLFVLIALMVPVGLIPLPDSITSMAPGFDTAWFWLVTVGLAVVGWIGWNVGLWLRGKRLRGLMALLDDLDRYHDVLGAIALLDDLEAARAFSTQRSGSVAVSSLPSREVVLDALRVTRATLMAGLMAAKIGREQPDLGGRCQELQTCIETHLARLQTLEVRHQADDYGQFVDETLQIGLSVQQVIQKLFC